MRRFVPGNSRRVDAPGDQSHPPQSPGGSNVDRDTQKERDVLVGKSDSESDSVDTRNKSKDLEAEEAPHPKRGLRRTGGAFTSDELARMSREDLVQGLKNAQRGEISNTSQGGSNELTTTDQASTTTDTLVAHNLSKQDRKKAINKHSRESFQAITGMKDGRIRPTVRDANGVIQYWTKNEHGINQLTPAWGEGFAANMRVWKKDFIHQVRVESEMEALSRGYLKTVSDDEFVKALEKGVCKTYSGYAKKDARGILEESQAAKRYNRKNERKSTKAVQRMKASEDTCVDSKLAEANP
ncbi:unnamed protein product [Rhizoctonia solani]|uniref:Uncharacterized protein n=1 Tax=Rhizoctonia solani TaxID=456999 RepID=A0A8H2WAZ5_9AGAM|nr:unnamed protein product [Rhizoctonia solani]